MTCIVFDTPGLIDLRSFTLMGVSVKPKTDSPIGYFGTGLKYAVAVMVRLGAHVAVWIGEDKYTFSKHAEDFRGTTFDRISMVRQRFGIGLGRRTVLPYTTQYGRSWERWMVVREIEANTRDEGGRSYVADKAQGETGRTKIVVADDPDFMEAYRMVDSIFLPSAERQGYGLEVADCPSDYLYWRGMRVYKLGKRSLLRYNILSHMTLTEDRTLAHDYQAKRLVAEWVQTAADSAYVEKVGKAGEEDWEYSLELEKYVEPSPAFQETMVRAPKGMSSGFWSYHRRHSPPPRDTYELFQAHPLPWAVDGSVVVDAKKQSVFDTPYGYEGHWATAAAAIIARLGAAAPKEEE